MTFRYRMGLLAGLVLLAACGEREVILPGERLDVRDPLTGPADATVEDQPAAQPDLAIALPSTVSTPAWTHRNGTPQHVTQHPAFSAQPTLLWRASVGQGEGRRHRITAEPVVADNRIFTLDSRAQVRAHGLDGSLLWSRDLTIGEDNEDDASGGGLAYADGTLYVTSGFGALTAIDAASGGTRWQQEFNSPVTAPPTVSGDLVYVMTTGSVAWAISTDNGRQRWSLPGATTLSSYTGGAAPGVTDQLVVFGFPSGEMAGVLKQSGLRVWGSAVSGERRGRAYTGFTDIGGAAVVAGEVVYAGNTAGRTAAIDARSGDRLWTAGQGSFGTVWPVDNSVFLINDQNEIVRLDRGTGDTIWAQPLPLFTKERERRRKAIFAHFGPVLAGGRLIVLSDDGLLRGFDPETGLLVQSLELPDPAATAPVFVGGTMYFVTTDGDLLAYR